MNKDKIRQLREERRKQENRRLILEAAERVILQKGTSAMTMDDVAHEAGFSKATLYHYFGNKGEVVRELMANYFEEVKRELQRIQTMKLGAGEKLKRSILFYLQFNQAKENLSRMLMMDRHFMERTRILVAHEGKAVSESDRKFIDMVKLKRQEILERGAQVLKEGMASGEFRKVDLAKAMTFLESALWGYCHARFWRERKYSLKEATELIHDFLLQGIGRKNQASKGDPR